jgi:serine/threonine-protein kinase
MSDKPAAEPSEGLIESRQFGPYRLEELINRGGMAEIWLVTDQNGKPFALRRLIDTSAFNFLEKKRFAQGCEVLSKIHNHEGIIGYVEHGKINGTPYLVMEYVEASNLKELLTRSDPVLAEYVGNILIDTATSLEHVHDSNFIHLDFKPENVLVTRNANVRLIDFDLAQPKPEKPKKMSRNPGTPAYMAPEQLLKQGIDHRTDIFAYGVTAYELLTGQKPFPGESPDEILRRQLDRAEFLNPRDLNPDIPASVEHVILKCLDTLPDERYPFTSVLVRDIQSALYV